MRLEALQGTGRGEPAVQVGDKKVLVLVSGGVDSAVCAALLKAALKAEQVEPSYATSVTVLPLCLDG